MKRTLVIALSALTLVSGCSSNGNNNNNSKASNNSASEVKDNCTPIVVATSSEKINLMSELGNEFKNSPQAKSLGKCSTVYPINVTSGDAAKNLNSSQTSWPSDNKAFWPTVWSPASTIWTDRVQQVSGNNILSNVKSFAKTPLVFAMPENMAKALGWPNKKIGVNDLEKIISSKDGWGSVGHPIWGQFKLAKTNPNTSTSGLETLLLQSYAANHKKQKLTSDDIAKAENFNKTFESAAIHYGDTTGNVLSTLYNNSQNGESNYVSAIALEETSLFNYNQGNPDSHTVQPGEKLTPPKNKLVAIYPSEGTLYSDNPVSTNNAQWVTDEQKRASEKFEEFIESNSAQKILPKYGFRSNDKNVDISGTINSNNGLDPKQPTQELAKPDASVVSSALDQWQKTRKPSAVMELIDLSGSMKESAGNGDSKLNSAIKSMQGTLDTFRNSDDIGLWGFTTGQDSKYGKNIIPVRDFGALNGEKEKLTDSIGDLSQANLGGTPLYDAISTTYDYMLKKAQPGRVNAIILLTDGHDTDSDTSLDSLVLKLKSSAKEGESNTPVRIFTIAYGKDADKNALKSIAEATGGQMFDSTDASRIDQVFTSVMNNF